MNTITIDSSERTPRASAAPGIKQPGDAKEPGGLHIDGEPDSLYDDDLDVEDDSQPQIDTDGRDDNAVE